MAFSCFDILYFARSLLCKPNTLDPKKVKGKILVCLRGETARAEKGQVAARAGAVGMILANDEDSGNEIIADPHFLPASHVNYTDGKLVFDYLNSTEYYSGAFTNVFAIIRRFFYLYFDMILLFIKEPSSLLDSS